MNQRDQKNHNQLKILDVLRAQDGVSQAEIAALLELQPSTISNLVGDIRAAGMVLTVAKGNSGSTGGKKADLLSLNPDYGCFGGFYLQNVGLTCRVLDFQGATMEEESLPTTSLNGDQIAVALSCAIERHRRRFPKYRGAGIAVSSIVTDVGDIVPSSFFEKSFPHILGTLRDEYPDLSVIAENDANALAYYDYVGSRQLYANILHLLVREQPFTVGAGLILDGTLYRGGNGAAGEISDEIIGGGERVDAVLRLPRFLRQFLDLDAVYISTPEGSDLESRIRRRITGMENSVEFTGGNLQAVKGAAMLAMQLHIKTLLPLSGRKTEELTC